MPTPFEANIAVELEVIVAVIMTAFFIFTRLLISGVTDGGAGVRAAPLAS